MAHKRKQIRDQILTVLTGLATTGANVFGSRVDTLQPGELPAICLFNSNEENEQRSAGGGLWRLLSVDIEVYVKTSTGDLDDQLDGIAEEIEAAIDGDRTFNGLAVNAFLESVNFTHTADADKPAGTMSLSYSIEYQTN